jgi:tetratricopeptide (TPR) repeat protein
MIDADSVRLRPLLIGSLVWLLVVISFPTIAVGATGDEGSAAGITLRLDPGARSSALGSAYVAKSNDPLSLHFNPASLGAQIHTESLLTHFQLIDQVDGISFNHLSFVTPLVQNQAGIGISLTSLDYGSLDHTRVQNRNPVTSGLGQFNAGDISASGAFGLSLTDRLKAGLTGTYFRSSIANYEANTFTGDIGVQYHLVPHGLVLGMAVRNLGGGITFIDQEDPLSTVYDLGVSSSWKVRGGVDALNISADLVAPQDADMYLATGLEYGFYRTLFLRAGYNGSQEADNGFTFGLGVHDRRFKINYSYVPVGELGNNQRITVSYIFGGLSESKTSQEDQPEPVLRKDMVKKQNGLKQKLQQPENYPYLKPGPGNPWLQAFNAGQRAYRDENYEKAYDYFLQVYRSKPNHIENLLWLGTIEWFLGQDKKARKRMKTVLELDPDNKVARKNLKRMQPSRD